MRALIIAAVLAFTAAPMVHAQSSSQGQPRGQSQGQPQAQQQGAQAQTPDRGGQCAGPDGKDATNAQCKGAGPAPAASSIYRQDAKGQCRDENGKAAPADRCKPPI